MAVSVLASCTKELEGGLGREHEYDPQIRFGVETYYGNNVPTKTEYSGELVGTPKYERINWNLGTDKVRVISDKGVTRAGDNSADYLVTANANSNAAGLATSEAEASPVTAGKELFWDVSNEDHFFFAVYPSPDATSGLSFITIDGGTKARITGTVPNIQVPLGKVQTVTEDLSDPLNPIYNTYEFTPDMTDAYMYASAKVAGEDVGVKKVPLRFKPLFNAYKFYLSAGDDVSKKFKITKLTLSSDDASGTDLAGDFTTTVNVGSDGYTGGFVEPTTDPNPRYREISMEVPAGDQSVLGTDTYAFTFLALPITQTRLTLTVDFQDCTDPLNPVARTRKLHLRNTGTNDWYTLAASRKLYVYAGLPDIEFVFEVTQLLDGFAPGGEEKDDYYSVTSYKRKYNRSTGKEEYEAVPWKVTEYNVGDGWKSIGTPGAWNPEWTVLAKYADTGKAPAGDPVDLSTAPVPYDAEMKECYNLEDDDVWLNLGNSTPATAIDLSNYDFMNAAAYPGRSMQDNPSDAPYETANCYVVSGPGWYKIPMVYGNAIREGGVNSYAYRNENYSDYMMGQFYQRGYAYIDAPWIYQSGGYYARHPHLLWQDVPGMVYVPQFDGDGTPDNPDGQKIFLDPYNPSEVRNAWCEDHYLYFKVDNLTNRAGGNAVIALCDDWGQPVWSWHIWAVPKSRLTTQKVYYWLDPMYAEVDSRPANTTPPTRLANNDMLDMNLGYVAGKPDRYCMVKFVQDVTGKEAVIHLVQRGDPSTASAVHYQWGRKDPMFSVSGNEAVNYAKTIYFEDGTSVSSETLPLEHTYDIEYYNWPPDYTSQTIENPYTLFAIDRSGAFTWSGVRYDNLWDATLNGALTDVNEHWDGYYVFKTVYDPCPPGFKVPNEYAFTGFNLKGMDANVITPAETADPTLVINGLKASFYIGAQYKPGEPFGSQGMFLYCDPRDKDNGIMFFPALGRRVGFGANAGKLSGMYSEGLYWTSAPFFDSTNSTLYARTFTMRRSLDDASDTEGYPQCIPVYTVAAAPSTMPFAGFLRAHGCQVRPVKDRYEDAGNIPFEVSFINAGSLTYGGSYSAGTINL